MSRISAGNEDSKTGSCDEGGLLEDATARAHREEEPACRRSGGRALLMESTAGAKAEARSLKGGGMEREGIWLECFESSFQLLKGNIYFLERRAGRKSEREREVCIRASFNGLDYWGREVDGDFGGRRDRTG